MKYDGCKVKYLTGLLNKLQVCLFFFAESR